MMEDLAIRNAMIVEALPLVRWIVREIGASLSRHVDREDLVGAGNLGLVLAARDYDPAHDVRFATYAKIRIRGAVMDHLRGLDWPSRSVRSNARQVERVREELCVSLQRSPTLQEVAGVLGVSAATIAAIDADTHRARLLALEGFGFAAETGDALAARSEPGGEELFLCREERHELQIAIDGLPEVLRYVLRRSYLDGARMSVIGNELDLTESRISQLRTEAVAMLRRILALREEGLDWATAHQRSDPRKRRRRTRVPQLAARQNSPSTPPKGTP